MRLDHILQNGNIVRWSYDGTTLRLWSRNNEVITVAWDGKSPIDPAQLVAA